MKTYFIKNTWLLFALALFFASPASSASAREELSFQYFYDTLSPYGEWVDVEDYGYCWRPTDVDGDWSPYMDGSWAWTDVGWTWVSREDWGDLVYHYGRWVLLKHYGWCWVPGYDWAPAWVSWRHSDDYIGWAPLPPEARWRPHVGLSIWIDSYCDIGPSYYSFFRVGDFCNPYLRSVRLPVQNNITIINNTVNVTNITYSTTQNTIFMGGPSYSALSSRSSNPIPTYQVADRSSGGSFRTKVSNNQLQVFRPQVASDPLIGQASARTKITKTVSADNIDRGWKSVPNAYTRNQLRSQIKAQTAGKTPDNAPAVLQTEPALSTSRNSKESPRIKGGISPSTSTNNNLTTRPQQTIPGAGETTPQTNTPRKGFAGREAPQITPRTNPGVNTDAEPKREFTPRKGFSERDVPQSPRFTPPTVNREQRVPAPVETPRHVEQPRPSIPQPQAQPRFVQPPREVPKTDPGAQHAPPANEKDKKKNPFERN